MFDRDYFHLRASVPVAGFQNQSELLLSLNVQELNQLMLWSAAELLAEIRASGQASEACSEIVTAVLHTRLGPEYASRKRTVEFILNKAAILVALVKAYTEEGNYRSFSSQKERHFVASALSQFQAWKDRMLSQHHAEVGFLPPSLVLMDVQKYIPDLIGA